MILNKKELRQAVLQRLKQQDLRKKAALESELYDKLFASPTFQSAKHVALTMSMPFEVNTQPIIDYLWQHQQAVYIPKVVDQKKLVWSKYSPDTPLIKSRFGILEPQNSLEFPPETFDLILVPGVAFTTKRERLGFGGGYYDRLLQDNRQIPTISLALPDQIVPQLPLDPWDLLVDEIITN